MRLLPMLNSPSLILPVLVLLAMASCADTQYGRTYERGNHVERVLQDVTAMLEGMAAARSKKRVVLRGPDFRSSEPRKAE